MLVRGLRTVKSLKLHAQINVPLFDSADHKTCLTVESCFWFNMRIYGKR